MRSQTRSATDRSRSKAGKDVEMSDRGANLLGTQANQFARAGNINAATTLLGGLSKWDYKTSTLTKPYKAVGASGRFNVGQYGTTVAMGGDSYTGCTFPVILQDYPTYNLLPMTNDSYITWSGSFRAFEAVL